ncbi:MAG TPA: alpha/beta hydrolase domain-containing protein, partial [Candidatus Binatia bacterium]|nr:alpha/beta hydrolase domain-containing protein [Candidatus Binatia bacterium]
MARPLAALLFLVALASPVHAAVPVPTIEGPITSPGAAFLQSTSFDLAQVGYVQEEFFISGTATAYANQGALGVDGMWTVTPANTAAYKTRILVRRPAQKKKFNGTVVVEWLNVSAGLDAAPDWTQSHVEFIRDGFAWVGVSAQFVGVEGGPGLVPVISIPLKTANPARYASLHHPGDSFSYDMFSQAGAAVRNGSATVKPLGGLKAKTFIAAGESQSAFRMVTYIDAIHPLTGVYDGYLVHSRSGFLGAPLSEPPQPAITVPGAAHIRADIDVPVLMFETESDLAFLDF